MAYRISSYNIKHKEIYYLIAREYWGKRYVKEATVALLDYEFNGETYFSLTKDEYLQKI